MLNFYHTFMYGSYIWSKNKSKILKFVRCASHKFTRILIPCIEIRIYSISMHFFTYLNISIWSNEKILDETKFKYKSDNGLKTQNIADGCILFKEPHWPCLLDFRKVLLIFFWILVQLKGKACLGAFLINSPPQSLRVKIQLDLAQNIIENFKLMVRSLSKAKIIKE